MTGERLENFCFFAFEELELGEIALQLILDIIDVVVIERFHSSFDSLKM